MCFCKTRCVKQDGIKGNDIENENKSDIEYGNVFTTYTFSPQRFDIVVLFSKILPLNNIFHGHFNDIYFAINFEKNLPDIYYV